MGKGDNLHQVQTGLDPTDLQWLNDQNPGMGERISTILTHLGNVLGAAAGHRGTVVLKKQKTKNTTGLVDASLDVEEGRIGNVQDPVLELDAVNFRTLKRWAAQAGIDPENVIPEEQKPVCVPTALNNSNSTDTVLTAIHAVQAHNDFIYVMGASGATGKFQVYLRTRPLRLIGQLTTTEAFQRMFLLGEYILGVKTDGLSQNLTVIDVRKPNALVELTVTNIGSPGQGIHAQGRYAYVATVAAMKIVDLGNVELPVVVGSI